MGFIKGNLVPIFKECRERPFSGSVLILGYPDVLMTLHQFCDLTYYYGVELHDPQQMIISPRPAFAQSNYLCGISMFKSLGFSRVDSLDYCDFEGASIVFDLNCDAPPASLLESYDVIIDHGTLEHVFNLPNALNNIFKMLKVGGRVIHSAPSSNFVDHGFYMFSPTLFHDFYMVNRYALNSIMFTQSSVNQLTDPCFYTDYTPGCLDNVSYGGLSNAIYGIICIATKTVASTGHLTPQQGIYKNTIWRQN